MSRPPDNAPPTLPRPPSTAITNAFRMNSWPTNGLTNEKGTITAPASAAAIVPSEKDTRYTRGTLTPTSAAPSRLLAAAGMALPSVVRPRNTASAPTATRLTTAAPARASGTATGPTMYDDVVYLVVMPRRSPPKYRLARLSKTTSRPSVTIMSAEWGASTMRWLTST